MAVLTAPPPPLAAVVDRTGRPRPHSARDAGRSAARRPRDVFVDVVRALGTAGVVLLHWTMAQAAWDGTTLSVGNALADGGGWVLTWAALTLALLFFAAGAGAVYQRAAAPPGLRPRWWQTLGGRLRTIGRPVGVFLAAWTVAVGVLIAVGVPAQAVLRMARMAPQLLWFLGVWIVLVTIAPLLQAAWRRWRWHAAAVTLAVPLLVDVVRFTASTPGAGDWLGGAGQIAWVNLLAVWAVPFAMGVAYATDRAEGSARLRRAAGGAGSTRPAEGASLRPGRGTVRLAVAAVVALSVAALLITVGPYPRSLVGMPGAAISNLGPPTAPVVAHSVAMVCAVLAAREVLVRWARRPGVTAGIAWLARHSMTVYLWHLSAMFAVVGVVLLGFDERLPVPWTADWWATRPVWFAAYGLALAGLVRVFGRFETHRTATSPAAGARAVRVPA